MFNSTPPLYPYSSFTIDKSINDKLYFFNSGRSGFLFIINTLKEQYNNLMFLVPAYTCHSVVEALKQSDVKYDFVDISNDLDLDLYDLDIMLEEYRNKKIALVATSLFGVKPRDYKLLYKDIIVIEDLAQSRINKNSSADFQFLSFGKGKLISAWNGGAVISKDLALKEKYDELMIKDDFMKSYILSNIQKVISKYFWFFIEHSSINPEQDKSLESHHVDLYKLSFMKQKWISTSIRKINLSHRIEVANNFLQNIDKKYLFELKQNTPYLRIPIKKRIQFIGVSYMFDYKYTYEQARALRNKEFIIPQLLVNDCSFLPTHDLINDSYVKKVIGIINE